MRTTVAVTVSQQPDVKWLLAQLKQEPWRQTEWCCVMTWDINMNIWWAALRRSHYWLITANQNQDMINGHTNVSRRRSSTHASWHSLQEVSERKVFLTFTFILFDYQSSCCNQVVGHLLSTAWGRSSECWAVSSRDSGRVPCEAVCGGWLAAGTDWCSLLSRVLFLPDLLGRLSILLNLRPTCSQTSFTLKTSISSRDVYFSGHGCKRQTLTHHLLPGIQPDRNPDGHTPTWVTPQGPANPVCVFLRWNPEETGTGAVKLVCLSW